MADLTKADMLIIRQVHAANMAFGHPFLPARKWWKKAKALAERGLLHAEDCQIVPKEEGCDGYMVTDAGIAAYNAVAGASTQSEAKRG